MDNNTADNEDNNGRLREFPQRHRRSISQLIANLGRVNSAKTDSLLSSDITPEREKYYTLKQNTLKQVREG